MIRYIRENWLPLLLIAWAGAALTIGIVRIFTG